MHPIYRTSRNEEGVDEVASAVQKCIRRGLEEDALYWGYEMMASPNPSHRTHLWNRLKVIASEDVGPACPWMPILIDSQPQARSSVRPGDRPRTKCPRS
jgi:replication-associated recombination protein RarA